MVAVGLYAALQVKPGKEEEVATFLRGALPLVEQEGQTARRPMRTGPSGSCPPNEPAPGAGWR